MQVRMFQARQQHKNYELLVYDYDLFMSLFIANKQNNKRTSGIFDLAVVC